MGAMASQATSLTIVYSTVYSGIDQRKHKSSASLAFVRVIHRWPVNSPHKWPVTRNMFPLDDVIMSRTRISPCITPCIPTVPFHVGVSYMCMSLSVYEQFSYRLEILHRLSLPSSVQNLNDGATAKKSYEQTKLCEVWVWITFRTDIPNCTRLWDLTLWPTALLHSYNLVPAKP